jgi:PhzF family phenazine biosynthesis protein
MHSFRQVDVFGSSPLSGNPVAVVHDADDLDDEQMKAFARWTNLSETTFLLRPTHDQADYRLRIFTPSVELPFAGHPTLGSAHAWLEAGGRPRGEDVVQECGAGLVTIRRGERPEFQAPPLVRSGPVEPDDLATLTAGLRLDPGRVVDAAWVDNGPGWVALLLEDAQDVLDCRPDHAALGGFDVGIVGPYSDGASDAAVEVRAFVTDLGIDEDPVTGSLNAGIAQWLAGTRLPEQYVASQGTVIGRRGRVHVRREGDVVWVGGQTATTLRGEATF